MSEHIIETGEFAGAAFVPVGGAYKLREEIVRCRDCKHYRNHIWVVITDVDDVCLFWHGKPTKVDAGGFCAWGERRES